MKLSTVVDRRILKGINILNVRTDMFTTGLFPTRNKSRKLLPHNRTFVASANKSAVFCNLRPPSKVVFISYRQIGPFLLWLLSKSVAFWDFQTNTKFSTQDFFLMGFIFRKWLFAHQPHIKCIRLGSVRSSHLPFIVHYARSSPCIFANGRIATTLFLIGIVNWILKRSCVKDFK